MATAKYWLTPFYTAFHAGLGLDNETSLPAALRSARKAALATGRRVNVYACAKDGKLDRIVAEVYPDRTVLCDPAPAVAA